MECESVDPAWNGEYWKVQDTSDILGSVEANVTEAVSLNLDGSWTNSNDSPVFRVVMAIGAGVGGDQVIAGSWETGEGGTIDLTLGGLGHVTFCFTGEGSEGDEDVEEPETTTTSSTTTTTSVESTTTTSQDASTPTTSGESTPVPSSETTTTAITNPTEVSDSEVSNDAQSESGDGEAESEESGSLAADDRDTILAVPATGGSGGPPEPGPVAISPSVAPEGVGGSHPWPTPEDLVILGVLTAAIGAVIGRRRLGRLVAKAYGTKG